MVMTLHSTWHSITAHFGAAVPMIASLVVIVGLIAKIIGKDDFAKNLTTPLHVISLLSIISILLACAGAVIDFPLRSFVVSPYLSTKVTLAVIAFFVYCGMYYTVASRKERVWEGASFGYIVFLAFFGALIIAMLGAIGGILATGHSVLEPLVKPFI